MEQAVQDCNSSTVVDCDLVRLFVRSPPGKDQESCLKSAVEHDARYCVYWLCDLEELGALLFRSLLKSASSGLSCLWILELD